MLAPVMCALWLALAAPQLQLVPGVGRLGSSSVAISLQSTLLGIDDEAGRPSRASVRNAARKLGVGASDVLSATMLHVSPFARHMSLVVALRRDPRRDTHATSRQPSQRTHVISTKEPTVPPPAAATPAAAPSSAAQLPDAAPAEPNAPTFSAAPHAPADNDALLALAPTPKGHTPQPAPTPAPPPPAAPTLPPSPPPSTHEPAIQSIVFDTVPPAEAKVGDPAYAVSVVASSGLPVTVTIDAASAGVCSIAGTTVTARSAGLCVINANQSGNAVYRGAPQAQQSFTIADALPSLSIQSLSFMSAPPAGAVVGQTYAVAASASSGLPVTLSATPGSAGVCTVTGAIAMLVGAGTCTIVANQDGNASYVAASAVRQAFAVGLRGQTIHFTSTPPSLAGVGGAPYVVSAVASSGLPVVFSADNSSASVCTVSGATVTPVGVGICTIDAAQFGNVAFDSAPQVQQSFSVGAGTPSQSEQSIQFTTPTPSDAAVGGATYTVDASASSRLLVAFSVEAASASVCSVSGSTVSMIGVGTCTIAADQGGDASYQPAPQVQQSFTVGRRPQTIAFTSTPPGHAVVGDPAYAIGATATSGLAVTLSSTSGSAGVCSVAGASVSLIGAGTCTIAADQAGDGTYEAAPQVLQSFTVSAPSQSVQSIDFVSVAPTAAVVGGGSYTVSATASSGLPVTFAVAAASAGVCSLAGTVVSFTGAGTCTIDADQTGNGSYLAAPRAQQSFAVGLPGQTIGFTSSPPVGTLAGDPPYTVSAAASSGLPVTFSAAPSSAGVCTVSDATVSFVGSGTCVIDADQAGNASYAAAAQVQQSFTVGIGAPAASVQSITFTSSPPAHATVGGTSYTVSATASSGLAVVFSAAGTSAGVCTVSGSTVSFTGVGTCTVNANQPGNASYQPAPQVQQSFAVGTSAQTISFTSTPPGGAVVGGATYSVSAAASSGLAVSFSIAGASAGVCTLAGTAVSFVGAGTCTVNADQAGNASYAAAPQAHQSFTVSAGGSSKSVQSIHFTSTPPSGATVGGAAYTVAANASSGLTVTFSLPASSTGVCTLSGSTVAFVGAGTCTINADQSGNSNYLAAPQVQQSFAVGRASQTIAFTTTPPSGAVVGGPDYAVSATASSGLTVSFAIDASSGGACTLAGTTVHLMAAGTCTIDANQSGNGNYSAASQVQQSFSIGRASQTITITSTPPNADKNDPPYTITATATSGLTIVFTTDPSSAGVCSVSGSTVSFEGRGTCIVYANQSGNANYLPAPQEEQVFRVKNHTNG